MQILNVLTVMILGQAIGIDVPAEAYFIAVPMVTMIIVLTDNHQRYRPARRGPRVGFIELRHFNDARSGAWTAVVFGHGFHRFNWRPDVHAWGPASETCTGSTALIGKRVYRNSRR